MDTIRDQKPSPERITETMLDLLAACGTGKSISPTDVARALGGPHPDGWGPLMVPVRRVAVAMAQAGRVAILRKGKPVDDLDAVKGVVRYRLKA